MPTLLIHLLGDVRILWEQSPLPPFPTHKTRALFAYLVTFRERAHPRSQLSGVFWGDYPEARANRNLNNTLWRLRNSLPEGYICSDAERLWFDTSANYWLDVAAFEAACDSPAAPFAAHRLSLEEAVRLYRGDFVEGWYEDWALVETERLRGRYLQALSDLIDCCQAGTELQHAQQYARRILEIDPLRESVHRRLMALYAALGQRDAALAQYETCRRLLKEEIGAEPDTETRALFRKLSSSQWNASHPAPQPDPSPQPLRAEAAPRTPFQDFGQCAFVGREPERARLKDWLASPGAPPLLLEGESGVGKTRLARECERLAQSLGMGALRGACLDMPTPPAYHGLEVILRAALPALKKSGELDPAPAWLNELCPLLPDLTGGLSIPLQPGGPDPTRLLEAAAQCLLALGRLAPQLILLEDLHWADPATLDALVYLAPRMADAPLHLLVTVRSEEIPDQPALAAALQTLEQGGMLRLRLARLDRAGSEALVCQMLGLADEQAALAGFLYQETGGNPLFIVESLKSLVEDHYLSRAPGGNWLTPWDWDGREALHLRPPRGVRETLQRRLKRLSPGSTAVLEIAAVLGSTFTLDLLQRAAALDDEALLSATDDLLRRQLITEADAHIEFSHNKLRQVVYEGIDLPRRRLLHSRAAAALAALAPERVEELANHSYAAQEDTLACSACLAAGERARAVYANRSALTYFTWAIESARRLPPAEGFGWLAQALEQRGQVWEFTGDYDEALADYASLRETAAERRELLWLARAIRRLGWVRGEHFSNWQAGLDESTQALTYARQASDLNEEARILLDRGAYFNMLGDQASAIADLQEALRLFQQLGDRQGEASCYQYMAVAYHFISHMQDALDTYRLALTAWLDLGDKRAASKTQTNIAYLALSLGQVDLAEEYFTQAEAILREINAYGALSFVLLGLAVAHSYRARFRQCLDTLAEATAFENRSRPSAYIHSLIILHTAMVYWHLGETQRSLSAFRDSLDLARQTHTPTLEVGILKDLGRCLRQMGDAKQAEALHTEALNLSKQSGFLGGELIVQSELGLDRITLALVEGSSPVEGLAMLEDAEQRSRLALGADSWNLIENLVNLAEGRLLTGQCEDALRVVHEALDFLHPAGLKESEIWARLVEGKALLALGRVQDARCAFYQGLACLDPSGRSLAHTMLEQLSSS